MECRYNDNQNKRKWNVKNEPVDVNEYFSRQFIFTKNPEWTLPERAFHSDSWSLKKLQRMKDELNEVKSQLSKYSLEEWSKHTRTHDPSSGVFHQLRHRIKPELLTQAWCKFYECLCTYAVIAKSVIVEGKLTSLHLCEAPGAFVCALNHFLKSNYAGINWQWFANSLNPHYEGNSVTEMIPDIRLMCPTTTNNWIFGADNTGDITCFYNYKHIRDAVIEKEVMLVTADGSVDCMHDPGNQERLVSYLHYCETITALSVLGKGGSFVLKMFTFFEDCSICLLYLLHQCFQQVHVFKPCSSKSGNSEVYVICLEYLGLDVTSELWNSLLLEYQSPSDKSMFSLNQIPKGFLAEVEKCALYFMKKQIKTINNNVSCFETKVTDKWVRKTQKKVVEQFMSRYNVRVIQNTDRIVVKNADEYQTDLDKSCYVVPDILQVFFKGGWVIGKAVPYVNYTRFCDMELLNNFRNFPNQFLIFNDFCCCSCNILDNIAYEKRLFEDIYNALDNVTDRLFLCGYIFVTRFTIGVLLMLLQCFQNVTFTSIGVVKCKDVNENLSLVKECFESMKNELSDLNKRDCEFVPAIVQVVEQPFQNFNYFSNHVFSYNNNTMEFIMKNNRS